MIMSLRLHPSNLSEKVSHVIVLLNKMTIHLNIFGFLVECMIARNIIDIFIIATHLDRFNQVTSHILLQTF